jgi:hypothetical protein
MRSFYHSAEITQHDHRRLSNHCHTRRGLLLFRRPCRYGYRNRAACDIVHGEYAAPSSFHGGRQGTHDLLVGDLDCRLSRGEDGKLARRAPRLRCSGESLADWQIGSMMYFFLRFRHVHRIWAIPLEAVIRMRTAVYARHLFIPRITRRVSKRERNAVKAAQGRRGAPRFRGRGEECGLEPRRRP